jgi:kynurenine formamidase
MKKVYDLSQPWSIHTPPWPYFPDPRTESPHRFASTGDYSKILHTSMHVGTHIDAPLHGSPRGWDLAEIPLDHLIGTGLIIDLSHLDRWDIVTPQIVEEAAPEEIRDGDILVFYYGWKQYGWCEENANETEWFGTHPGPYIEFCDWMKEKRIKWVGADCPSLEHPMNAAIRDNRPDLTRQFEEKMGKSIEEVFPREKFLYCHHTILGNNQMMVECLAGDIDQVLGRRLTLGAFPWRWVRGEASLCRVLAFEADIW